ncbi:MAG: hypothetical protein IE922_09645 [Sphingomonadales bacterium]|nr:hypothetical protein [Sphingomonadales bacterium]
MALLTFPLPVSDFMGRLPIAQATFEIPESLEVSETDGGDILTAEIGTRLWRGEITLGKITRDEEADAATLIDVLRSGRTFLAYDVRRPWPRADVNGTILGASAVQIHTLEANNRQMRLKGLPPGYELRRGDYIGWDYGANPVRRALHKVVDLSVTASGTGITPSFEVVPNIRAGAAVSSAVRLVRAYCTAIIVPGSVSPGASRSTLTEGTKFSWQQTLRY